MVGIEGKNLWCVQQGVPVVTAPNRCRPGTAAEILAYTTLRRAALDFGKAGTSNLLFSFGVNVTTAEAFHADAFDAFRTNASAMRKTRKT